MHEFPLNLSFEFWSFDIRIFSEFRISNLKDFPISDKRILVTAKIWKEAKQ